jgi:hypothetical protein
MDRGVAGDKCNAMLEIGCSFEDTAMKDECDETKPARPNWTDEHLPMMVRRQLLGDELNRLRRVPSRVAKAADVPQEDHPGQRSPVDRPPRG